MAEPEVGWNKRVRSETMAYEDVQPKPAATVMLIRNVGEGAGESAVTTAAAGSGVEVFMLRRTPKAAFASGMYVFPGGKCDPGDDWAAADGGAAGDEGSETAARVAAIRECYEEAGVLLAVDRDGGSLSDGHAALAHRDEVYSGALPLRKLMSDYGVTPMIDDLAWVAHWITPRGESSRRFDTRFYLAVQPAGQSSHHDDNETVASEWVRPADAIAHVEAGEWMMMPPTVSMLRFLAGHPDTSSAISAGRAIGTPPTILPKILFATDDAGDNAGEGTDGGAARSPLKGEINSAQAGSAATPGARRIIGVVLPGEPGYDDLD
jgi:8-oxo-dGTP pyrophosphatase MutT (NUDIX family)